MTTKRLYYCNLCNERIEPADSSAGMPVHMGIYWDGSAGEIGFTVKPVRECETHLCLSCYESILRIASANGDATLTKKGSCGHVQ